MIRYLKMKPKDWDLVITEVLDRLGLDSSDTEDRELLLYLINNFMNVYKDIPLNCNVTVREGYKEGHVDIHFQSGINGYGLTVSKKDLHFK